MISEKRSWKYEEKECRGFTDLGKQVIRFKPVSENLYNRGLEIFMEKQDLWPKNACTAIAKKNSAGEVIVGRNQDMELSNCPVYIVPYGFGKYETIGFFYNNVCNIDGEDFTYEKMLAQGITDDFIGQVAVSSTDAFNEKGLYVQANMRTTVGTKSSGTNPGASKRLGELNLVPEFALNCATVKECLEYIKTLDVFSLIPDGPECDMTWGYALLLADAAGEYGVLEFANNVVFYTPYASGHANYFVHPALHKMNFFGTGYGRLSTALDELTDCETEHDIMEAIHKADWIRAVRDFRYTYKDENGTVRFVDKDGNKSVDTRDEISGDCTFVDNDGNIVDDVSNLDGNTQFKYLKNCSAEFSMIDENWDKVRPVMEKRFFSPDNTGRNWTQLVELFDAGNPQPMKDNSEVWSTGMNFGVNCAKKHLVVRLLEDENAVYEVSF